ncbi:uncharacterized protein [Nicotiana sylvestris]|uniref:Uncharacterized protein LOC104216234 n=1 Tax=Nicotiana sylvestris TaxID=4096 RepID=A0A1U7V925_NICSY|nr:PREDICTED: uncharacterized protein LOC104216234 [Nicotiana sylvestris]
MKSFIVKTDERLDVHGAAIKELCTSLRSLERQVGQIATILFERIPITLSADTQKNPKEKVNFVTLRKGQVLKDPTLVQKEVIPEKVSGNELKIEDDKKKKGKKGADKKKKEETSRREEQDVSEHMPALPFPQKLYREKLDKQSSLTNASLCKIHEGDLYKKEIEAGPYKKCSVVKLTEHCSAILQNKLPQKCGDPWSFTIHFSLGTLKFDKSLCDSGASINLIPLSIYKKLETETGEIRSAPILQLADQTKIISEGIVEDVLVRVDKFVFPVDFIVVNMEENKEIPLILGRPFLATGRAILYIHEKKLMLRVGEETVTFKMDEEIGVKKEKQVLSGR